MEVLPYPIPLALSGGVLSGLGFVDGSAGAFPLVVDTGSVLTTYDDGSGATRARLGDFTLAGLDSDGSALKRLAITRTQLFMTPLASVGVGDGAPRVGGILGGDNLSRFAVSLDYRAAQPAMTLVSTLTSCTCELSAACNAVLPFRLAGGQESSLQSQVRVQIGNDLFTYPPTRVLLDACLEPYEDPLALGRACVDDGVVPGCALPRADYLPSGLDVKLVVSSGFPGLALSASAFDRLRGPGASAALTATAVLHLPDAADAAGGAGVIAKVTTLGQPMPAPASGASLPTSRSALALVSREGFFGPCAELGRSRRLRRGYTHPAETDACLLNTGRQCNGQDTVDPFSAACARRNASNCSDRDGGTAAAAMLELRQSLPLYVLPDVTPLLVAVNDDVRPAESTVEGVIGTALLQKLVSTIDYPGTRLIARCVDGSDQCVAYRRMTPSSFADCGYCQGPARMQQDATAASACPAAP